MSDPRNMKEVAQKLGLVSEPEATEDGQATDAEQTALKIVTDAGLGPEYATFLKGVVPSEIPDRITKLKALTGHKEEPEHVRVARQAIEHAEKVGNPNSAEYALLNKPKNQALVDLIHGTNPKSTGDGNFNGGPIQAEPKPAPSEPLLYLKDDE